MSQYPSPYSPPPVPPNYGYDFNYYQPQPDMLGPARRASVIMFVMGGLLAIGGLCCGAVGALAPLDQIMSQNPALSSTPGVTPELMKMSVIVMGVLALLFGMALLILGYFVRGGGMGAVVTSLVLVGIAVLLGGLVVLSGLFQLRSGAGGGGPQMFIGLCMYVLPLVLLIVLLTQLIQAAKMAPRVAQAKNQYQQQYWQYQQQQQMYQAGYTAPPLPPSPPPPPPEAPPQDEPGGDDPTVPRA